MGETIESEGTGSVDDPPLGKSQNRAAFAEALAEHDPSLSPPTERELADMIRAYIRAENEERRLELELERLRREKSQIARTWVVRRGTAGTVVCRGETWSVQSTRFGAFCFRRYTAPAEMITITLEEDSPPRRAVPPSPSPKPPTKGNPARIAAELERMKRERKALSRGRRSGKWREREK